MVVLPAPQTQSSDPWMSGHLEAKAPVSDKRQDGEAEETPEAIMARLQRTLAERSGH